MKKQHWITVLMDGTVPRDKMYDLIDGKDEEQHLQAESVRKNDGLPK